MSDEIDEAPVADTPNVEAPETDVNWQKRYEDLRPEFDRTRQTLSKFESDPAAVVEFLQQHHPDLLTEDEPDDEPEEDDDETPPFLTRSEFTEWQKEQATQKANEVGRQQYETDLKKFAGERELSKHGRNAIDASALRGEITTPEQLKQAVDEWFAYEDELRGPSKTRRAPHVMAGGKAVTGGKDPSEMTRAELNQFMGERMQAAESQT